ncbi:MAG: OB-fold nucleic acid binding domain-containing protein [Pseudobdellovibrionaceae bacterium]
MSLELGTNVQYLKGVGPKLAELLAKRGLQSIGDLLEYYPRAFEDRRAARNIASLKLNDIVSLRAFVLKVNAIPMGTSRRKIYDIVIRDTSGQIHCKYFRVPYKGYFERFTPGTEVRITGKVIDYRGRLEFHHPEIREHNEEEEIQDILVPIYTEIESLTSAKMLRMIRLAMEALPKGPWAKEQFPADLMQSYNLISRQAALEMLHKPSPDLSQALSELKSPAHRRIIFEEFFWLELYLAAKKVGLQREPGIAMENRDTMVGRLIGNLPFQMTGAQKRSFEQNPRRFAEASSHAPVGSR